MKIEKIEKKRKKRDLQMILAVLVMLIGWYVLMFPTSADLINRIYNINVITSFQEDLITYTPEELEQMMNDCIEYNQSIYQEQQKQTFMYRGANVSDDRYNSLPTTSSTIGSLYIPKLDLTVAIARGTKDRDLQSSAGHLYGTSLPVEGENVHSVIAGHSALASAELFTHLNKMKKDDTFYITILNKKYEYKVVDINVCLPEDDWEYEQIEEGKNYATLYTCTPYGVNTHRLLVKGEFVGQSEITTDDAFEIKDIMPIIKYSCRLALIILAPFIVALLNNVISRNKRKKKKKKEIKDTNVSVK